MSRVVYGVPKGYFPGLNPKGPVPYRTRPDRPPSFSSPFLCRRGVRTVRTAGGTGRRSRDGPRDRMTVRPGCAVSSWGEPRGEPEPHYLLGRTRSGWVGSDSVFVYLGLGPSSLSPRDPPQSIVPSSKTKVKMEYPEGSGGWQGVPSRAPVSAFSPLHLLRTQDQRSRVCR